MGGARVAVSWRASRSRVRLLATAGGARWERGWGEGPRRWEGGFANECSGVTVAVAGRFDSEDEGACGKNSTALFRLGMSRSWRGSAFSGFSELGVFSCYRRMTMLDASSAGAS